MAAPVLNHRGFAMPRRPGPAPGCNGRRSPRGQKIEAGEAWVAQYVRGLPHLVTGETIIAYAIDRIGRVEGVTDYCLCVHGAGSKVASAWLTKWKKRFGFRSRRQHVRVRTRRNGVELRSELFYCWRGYQAVMGALDPDSDPDVKFYMANCDETGLWLVQPNDAIVAQEQMAEREEQLSRPTTEEKASVVLSVTSDDRFTIEPMIMIHRCRNSQRAVLLHRLRFCHIVSDLFLGAV